MKGVYAWIAEAVEHLHYLRQALPGRDAWLAELPTRKVAVERLLSGAPCPQEDLGFGSPADERARLVQGMANWKASAEEKDRQLADERRVIGALEAELARVNGLRAAASDAVRDAAISECARELLRQSEQFEEEARHNERFPLGAEYAQERRCGAATLRDAARQLLKLRSDSPLSLFLRAHFGGNPDAVVNS